MSSGRTGHLRMIPSGEREQSSSISDLCGVVREEMVQMESIVKDRISGSMVRMVSSSSVGKRQRWRMYGVSGTKE